MRTHTARRKRLHPRCMQCGGPATTRQLDMRTEYILVTTWCDFHAPTVWDLVARARRLATKRQDELEGRWLQ